MITGRPRRKGLEAPIKGEAKNALSLWERDKERDEELSTNNEVSAELWRCV
jgi:hypothetical protein